MKKYFFLSLSVSLLFISFNAKAQTLTPIHDAYLENGTLYNNEVLRVENAPTRVRETYLMFDLSGITGTITDVKLELTVYTDPGSGTINLYKGSSDNWTETNLSNTNKPDKGNLLGSITGTHGDGDIKIVNIDPNMVSGNFLSLVLDHTTASDVGFAATGPETSSIFNQAPAAIWPRLLITSSSVPADTMAPTVPTGITASNVTATSVDLSWTPSTDNGGGTVAGYNIVNNGGLMTSVTGTSTALSSLTENTQYNITVEAYDNASTPNVSGPSTPSVQFTTLSSGGAPPSGSSVWSEQNATASYADNVAIGTTIVPNNYKLAVNGKIIATELKVQLQSNWPDYVFAKNYTLPTLEEIEKHIEEKGHLINIPSAKEVAENGIELGKMNKLLLEKIEELTLYILEQQKELKSKESRINSLEADLDDLKMQLKNIQTLINNLK